MEVFMEDGRFDNLTKVVSKLASRRTTLRGLVAGTLATALALDGLTSGEPLTAVAKKGGCKSSDDCKQPSNPCQRRVCDGRKCRKEARQDGAPCGDGSTCQDGECPITVTAADMQGWQFYDDQNDAPIDPSFSEGPDTPPLGVGSAHLAVELSSEGIILSSNIKTGEALKKFETLVYSSYQTNSSGGAAPALNLGIDLHAKETPKSPDGHPGLRTPVNPGRPRRSVADLGHARRRGRDRHRKLVLHAIEQTRQRRRLRRCLSG
jgi:hypothetical protein